MRLIPRLLLLTAACLLFYAVPAQISQGGEPLSFGDRVRPVMPVIELPAPDLAAILREDEALEKQGQPQRVAVAVPVAADTRSGAWELRGDGISVWRLRLTSPGALALSAGFEDFHLPQGARLFLYNDDRDFLIGAFTSSNNPENQLFATELIPGDAVNLELEVSATHADDVRLRIGEVSYLYRFMPLFFEGRGTSDHCEVNVNCPEGENWQNQKRGVARIYVKKGSSYFWCTGSLLNNERMDRTPYFLTADHCAPNVTPGDLSNWIFYFNYESPGCEDPAVTPLSGTMTGATMLASADVTGSDFMLVLLNDSVPESYSPFFMGWNAEDEAGVAGVTIHHPAGDIKKISTYTEPVTSSQWSSTLNTHWEVYWSQTESGWGVTEGGSSGAPLFNENGMVIGTLTGGLASCDPGGGGPGTGPDKPDQYGKFSYSWDRNGTTPEKRLKDWLDPDGTGITFLQGMNTVLTADFLTDGRLILAGGQVTFSDLSSGPPVTWEWHFEGGEPETYVGKTPPAITYARGGRYNVRLIVSDGQLSDTLTRRDYIEVVGNIYPNPTRGKVNIFLGEAEAPSYLKVEVFDAFGKRMYYEEQSSNSSPIVTADLTGFASGVYIVRIEFSQRYLFSKVMVIGE